VRIPPSLSASAATRASTYWVSISSLAIFSRATRSLEPSDRDPHQSSACGTRTRERSTIRHFEVSRDRELVPVILSLALPALLSLSVNLRSLLTSSLKMCLAIPDGPPFGWSGARDDNFATSRERMSLRGPDWVGRSEGRPSVVSRPRSVAAASHRALTAVRHRLTAVSTAQRLAG